MNLGDLITRLEAADPNQVIPHGFHNPHSYRGDYYDLAFEPATNITVADMLEAARSAVGATYQGYKGGDFKMTADDWCWLSEEGSASGETISPLLLDLMLTPAGAADAAATRSAALLEGAEVAVQAARGSGHGEAGQYAASVAAGIGKELRRLAAEVEQLRKATPALSTDRIWQVQVQRRNGSWVDHSPPTIHGSEAQAEYEQAVASTGHLWSYRLVCTDRTHTVTAQHNRPEEARRG